MISPTVLEIVVVRPCCVQSDDVNRKPRRRWLLGQHGWPHSVEITASDALSAGVQMFVGEPVPIQKTPGQVIGELEADSAA